MVTRQNSDILFEDCTFRERQYFNLSEFKAASQTTMSLRFRDCRLVDHDETQNFYDRITLSNADSSRCTVSVDARKMKTGRPFLGTKRRAAHDFTIRNSNVEGVVVDKYQSNIKDKDVDWPDSLTSENRLYLPPGSMVTTVTVKKDSVPDVGGVSNYRLRIYDNTASVVVWQTADFKEEDALYKTYELADPYIVPASPDNHIRLAGLNGTVDKGDGGAVIVGYYTP